MKKTTFLMLLLLSSLSGCGSKSDGDKDVSEVQDPGELNGLWKSNCHEIAGSHYVIEEVEFSESNYHAHGVVFEDDQCTISAEIAEQNDAVGTIKYGSSGLSSEGLEVTQIDFNSGGETVYTIYRLSDGALYFGWPSESADGTTSQTRNTVINFDVTYSRQ